MSLIDFFTTKPSVAVASEMIWMTPKAKLLGLVAQVQDRLDANRFVLIVAHFPATLAKVKQELSAAGVPNEFHDGRLSRQDLVSLIDEVGGQNVLLVLAASLVCDEFLMKINDSVEKVTFVIAERHFLRQKDEAIQSFARTLGRPCDIVFHLSLHDPLMKHFAGIWIENLLKRLGKDEWDAIESNMVASQVKVAQAKFSPGVFGDGAADSAEEWLRLNVPELAV